MVLVGQSIGCSPALTLAQRGYGSKLVLISPFSTLSEMATEAFPVLRSLGPLLSFFLRDSLDNMAAAPSVTIPTLILHGTVDEVVPFSHGERLAGKFPRGTCQFEAMEGAGHNDIFDGNRLEKVTGRVVDFSTEG